MLTSNLLYAELQTLLHPSICGLWEFWWTTKISMPAMLLLLPRPPLMKQTAWHTVHIWRTLLLADWGCLPINPLSCALPRPCLSLFWGARQTSGNQSIWGMYFLMIPLILLCFHKKFSFSWWVFVFLVFFSDGWDSSQKIPGRVGKGVSQKYIVVIIPEKISKHDLNARLDSFAVGQRSINCPFHLCSAELWDRNARYLVFGILF